jgi:hypothetical protein
MARTGPGPSGQGARYAGTHRRPLDLRNLAVGHYAFIVEMSRPNGVVARGQRRVVIVE